MKKSKLLLTGFLVSFSVLFIACSDDDDNGTIEPTNSEKALAILQSIQTGDVTAMQDYVSQTTYIQHNLSFFNFINIVKKLLVLIFLKK